MAYPLEQGLKLFTEPGLFRLELQVLMAYPLEQGLKHPPERVTGIKLYRLNGLSTRTRIETHQRRKRYY